jgi:type II secretory pathway component PulK
MKHKQIKTRSRGPCRQRGVTLIIALMMLAALGLLAAWALKAGTLNVQAVGNMQARQQVLAAAQTAIETTISSPEFSQQPATVAERPIRVDIDGDGAVDLTAALSPVPACYRVMAVKMSELDPSVDADRACVRPQLTTGIESDDLPAGESLCADSEWNLRATVADATTGARVAVNQGVALRGLITDAANSCP